MIFSLDDRVHPGFIGFFSREELREIYDRACIRAYDCFVIFNKKYFFELSIEGGRGVQIFCGYNDNYEREIDQLDKKGFLQRLRAWPPVEIKTYEVS